MVSLTHPSNPLAIDGPEGFIFQILPLCTEKIKNPRGYQCSTKFGPRISFNLLMPARLQLGSSGRSRIHSAHACLCSRYSRGCCSLPYSPLCPKPSHLKQQAFHYSLNVLNFFSKDACFKLIMIRRSSLCLCAVSVSL